MIITFNAVIAILLSIYTTIRNIDLKKVLKLGIFAIFMFNIIFFIGMRSVDAGIDTPFYIDAFNSIKSFYTSYSDASSSFGSKEPLFWYFSGFLKNILYFTDQQWLMGNAIFSIFLSYIVYLQLQKRIQLNLFVPFILLFFTYFFVAEGNIMRQMFALPFFFFAILAYENNKKILFIIYAFIAVGFHFSTAIVFFYPLFKLFRINYIALIFIGTITIPLFPYIIDSVLHLINMPALLDKWTLYTTSYISPYGPTFKRPTILLVSFILVTYLYLFRKENYSNILFSMNLFFLFILLITSFNSGIAERYIIYLYFLLPVTIWKMITLLNSPHEQLLARLFVIILFYFQSVYIFSKEGILFTLGIQGGLF